jgi:hypothetical protein
MKYMVLIYTDGTLLDELPEGKFDSMMRGCLSKADDLRRQGSLLDSQMLEDGKSAKSIRIRNGRSTTVDGPYTETKELLAGFNLIEAENMDEAMRIAMEFPWAQTGCIEVRPVRDIAKVSQRVGYSGAAAG